MSFSELKSGYIGRFAPSPTGSLHLGSLLAAMASYCEAKKNKGEWLVRVEDIDPPREIKGASKQIIDTLENYGFQFNKKILYQSDRSQKYQEAIIKLTELSAIYYCTCSRTELKNQSHQTHICRNRSQHSIPKKPYSIKLKVPDKFIAFTDLIQGQYEKNLLEDCGDFVIKRKDELFSYQIAVVVDDEFQNVNHIIRGTDLIDSTPWQIYLISLLQFKQPTYAHIPIVTNAHGQKLSKQTFAEEIDNINPLKLLITAYNLLNQEKFLQPPKNISEFWHQAILHWDINKITKVNAFQV